MVIILNKNKVGQRVDTTSPYPTLSTIFLFLTLILTFTLDTSKFTRGIISLISLMLFLIYYFMYHYEENKNTKMVNQ